MYQVLLNRYVIRFFEETVKDIPQYIDGGYNGPNLSPLPEGVVFGDNIIVTGIASVRNETPMRTTGKSSFIVDLATRLSADTIVDYRPRDSENYKKISGENSAYIQEKSGAVIRDAPQGKTITDINLYLTVRDKPPADNVIFCIRNEQLYESDEIDIMEYYIKLIEIYGVHKVTVIRLVKAPS